ncbi:MULTISPECIES: LysR substrate-binding domain-containing protein [unclassified Serratia (in: enterobacteria)]|uniref:LysR substrate-binding domain-containing protein n=1 Tax=unclassified Serratia (in: enterobacteria) TaxID=2647522 RepID=UPI00164CF83D|nr:MULTISPECIES: LysR substrate-binding domain-containing protein [unclassified Serratia (in: enterobacteria)]MBU3892247.1 LysR family transcriptional regulator [Serratia rubidaea]MCA4822081.1 LysR family transcriptional regulator [Serratia rubidaea]QPT15542.1 LysR family transcriptional regulator [Serratia rubidaea]
MDKLNRMAVFAVVVAEGSLAAAARRLGMSSSAVSQHLRALESSLGVPLLHRSTRKLALTEAGAAFYPGCEAMLQQAQQAQQRLAELRDTLVGELRIATTVGIGGGPLAEALAPLLQAHPQLTLRVLADDRVVDMIEQRVDISLRVSRQLADTSMIAHALSEWPMVLCAAPRYLSQHGVPETPQALQQHRWISGNNAAFPLDLHHASGETFRLRQAQGQIVSDSMHVMRAFTRMGLGISGQPLYEIGDELRRGELIALLPAWRPTPLRLHALTLERAMPEKTRQALRYLRDYFRRLAEKSLAINADDVFN